MLREEREKREEECRHFCDWEVVMTTFNKKAQISTNFSLAMRQRKERENKRGEQKQMIELLSIQDKEDSIVFMSCLI